MGRDLLKLVAISTLLVVAPALAQDAPRRMWQVEPARPELVAHPGWVLTDEGRQKLAAQLTHDAAEKARLRAENGSLREDLVEWQAKPALTWRGAALLVGAGVALGLAVGVPVALAVRR